MKEVTVIELSEQTGLTRSKIYYLIKTGKLSISEGKINSDDAIKVITELSIKKNKMSNDIKFRHILNMLNLQNDLLQKQLDLALEREKIYLAELSSFRKILIEKIDQISTINRNNTQKEQTTIRNEPQEVTHSPPSEDAISAENQLKQLDPSSLLEKEIHFDVGTTSFQEISDMPLSVASQLNDNISTTAENEHIYEADELSQKLLTQSLDFTEQEPHQSEDEKTNQRRRHPSANCTVVSTSKKANLINVRSRTINNPITNLLEPKNVTEQLNQDTYPSDENTLRTK
ncbi:MAG: hypothetical protein E6657_04085 [Acinetobacter sp.]|uniref:hypothetical protein n=1 Tax=Acinetobacter TaxID=469 RepID=UPI000689D3D5|nr:MULTISPECIES: hypothetical protein [Acinetobacter]MDU6099961.1 hypothetical protein [Acinetobacter sp.]RZH03321.1 hypothetical protein EXE00_18545 [Acinetobacter pittii]